jgi:hypothetical protein
VTSKRQLRVSKFLEVIVLPGFILRLVQRHSRSQETDFDIFTVVVPSGLQWDFVDVAKTAEV